jgi:hypothetical protein
MNYPARIEKKIDDHYLDFSFARVSFLLPWTLACAIPKSAYWFQGNVQKTNLHNPS